MKVATEAKHTCIFSQEWFRKNLFWHWVLDCHLPPTHNKDVSSWHAWEILLGWLPFQGRFQVWFHWTTRGCYKDHLSTSVFISSAYKTLIQAASWACMRGFQHAWWVSHFKDRLTEELFEREVDMANWVITSHHIIQKVRMHWINLHRAKRKEKRTYVQELGWQQYRAFVRAQRGALKRQAVLMR